MTVRFEYRGPSESLSRRTLLARPVAEFHAAALAVANRGSHRAEWVVELGPELLFDEGGLAVIAGSLENVLTDEAEFLLAPDPLALRDYYSHQPDLSIPVVARRGAGGTRAGVHLDLPARRYAIPFPASMRGATDVSVPTALLMRATSAFDPLFANQIASLAAIERGVRRSPRAAIQALLGRGGSFGQRAGRAFAAIHRDAEVHPTAVVEGSVVEAGARIGAHCTVRYSWIGECARLHDGAKVELSVVGRNTWLMHDLVLYRSVAEDDVFLIHGPYQFSLFQHRSAAFATILMDYRPDEKPIRIETGAGRSDYGGLFLGAVYEEGSKTLGGTALAPGRVVPRDTWLAADPESVHLLGASDLAPRTPLAPRATRGD